ncbi:MAG: response regulator [Acidobacteria bacterium]|nr:response regulator [Acidobacteriota bacterium]
MSHPKHAVLVVEDGPSVRRLICEMLLQMGYEVLEAADGLDALAILDRHRSSIGLVLTDVVMPRMGGGELARRIGEMHPEIPILFMSGYPGEVLTRELGEFRGAYLQKPFTSPYLAEAVRHALETSGPAQSGRGIGQC